MTRSINEFKVEILGFFIELNSEAGHLLNTRALHQKYIPGLNPKEKQSFVDAANELIDEGLVEEAEAMGLFTLRITESGIKQIYSGDVSKSATQIMDAILSIFRHRNSSAGHVLGHRDLSDFYLKLNVLEKSLFDEASDMLVSKGFAELAESAVGSSTFRLTDLGVDYIY